MHLTFRKFGLRNIFLYSCILYGCIREELAASKKISKKSFARTKEIKAKMQKILIDQLESLDPKVMRKFSAIDLGFNMIDLLKERSKNNKHYKLYDCELCFAAIMRTIYIEDRDINAKTKASPTSF